jgi:hypothetical protein
MILFIFVSFYDPVGSSLYVATVLINSRNKVFGMLLAQHFNGSEKNRKTSKHGG